MTALAVAVLAGMGVALALPPRPAAHLRTPSPVTAAAEPGGSFLRRHRVPLSLLAALVGPAFLDPPLAWVAGCLAAVVVWSVCTRDDGASPREEAEVRRQLPQVVRLLARALAAGAPLAGAVAHVAEALPGPASQALRSAQDQLQLGVDPARVWAGVAARPGLARVGRALARSVHSGAPVADVIDRLAHDLAEEARLDTEERARSVGVRAAVPLGLCLLPAFLVVGIVPVVVTTLSSVTW